MKMKSLKMSKPKKVLREKMAVQAAEQPEYPWGLELDLDSDTIKKLGIDFKNQTVGDSVHFTAKAKITRMSENQDIVGGGNRSLGLQITSMGWGKEK